jgi:hypothetical protein
MLADHAQQLIMVIRVIWFLVTALFNNAVVGQTIWPSKALLVILSVLPIRQLVTMPCSAILMADLIPALGLQSMYFNTTGIGNTARIWFPVQNTNGVWNSAYGYSSMFANVTGQSNSALGINSYTIIRLSTAILHGFSLFTISKDIQMLP